MTTALIPHPEFYCGDGDYLRDHTNRVQLTRVEVPALLVDLADRLYCDGQDTLAQILYIAAQAAFRARANELLGTVLDFERKERLYQL